MRKPPIGIKPRYIHDAERLEQIINAMANFSEYKKPIPQEWIKELYNICDYFVNRYTN